MKLKLSFLTFTYDYSLNIQVHVNFRGNKTAPIKGAKNKWGTLVMKPFLLCEYLKILFI